MLILYRLTIWAAVFLILTGRATAQSTELDSAIESAMRAGRTPALSVAVVKDGKLLWCKGYGIADPLSGVAAGPDTMYGLASLTKPLTATGVLLLVEDGTVSLSDPVATYVPTAPATWAGITIEHLLTHTSGLPDFINDKIVPQDRDAPVREMIAMVAKQPVHFVPGARREYSNTNYLLLGEVIRTATGRPWDEFLTQRVFGPLEMSRTVRRDPAVTRGFMKDGDVFVPAWPLRASIFDNADGGLVSSAADLARFEVALRAGRVLKPETLAMAVGESGTPRAWERNDVRGRVRIEHGGRRSGASAQFTHFPDDKLTVIVLGNSKELDAVAVVEIVAATFNPVYGPVRLMKPSTSSDSQVDEAVGAWVKAVAEGDGSSPAIAPGTAAAFIPDASGPMATMLKSGSTFEQVWIDRLPRPSRRNGHDATSVAYYRSNSSGGEVFPMFYLDASGTVVDYDAVRYGAERRSSTAVWVACGATALAVVVALRASKAMKRPKSA